MGSVLDVGCGLGSWLAVFRDNGVTDILGLDGGNVDVSRMYISPENFRVHDLRDPFNLERRFDLVLCLEVAEHLPEACASRLVATMCAHSDTIVFSAAIPGQGGQNHINEQWPSYWRRHFEREGYVMADLIRPVIWDNPEVDVWYRQNMFVYVRNADNLKGHGQMMQMAEIHPDLWAAKCEALARLSVEVKGFDDGKAGIQRSFRALANAVRNKLTGR